MGSGKQVTSHLERMLNFQGLKPNAFLLFRMAFVRDSFDISGNDARKVDTFSCGFHWRHMGAGLYLSHFCHPRFKGPREIISSSKCLLNVLDCWCSVCVTFLFADVCVVVCALISLAKDVHFAGVNSQNDFSSASFVLARIGRPKLKVNRPL